MHALNIKLDMLLCIRVLATLVLEYLGYKKGAIRFMLGVPRRSSCRNVYKHLHLLPILCIFIYEVLLLVKSLGSELRNKNCHSYFTR